MQPAMEQGVRVETLKEIAARRRLSWTTVRTVAILARVATSRTRKTITLIGPEIERLDRAIDEFLTLERKFK